MENEKSKILDLEGKNVVKEVKKDVKEVEPLMCPFGTSVIGVPARDRLGQPILQMQQISSVCMKEKCKMWHKKWNECIICLSLAID